MKKQKVIEVLNEKIDRLILTGLEKEKDKQEFQRLCKLHKQLIVNHLQTYVK